MSLLRGESNEPVQLEAVQLESSVLENFDLSSLPQISTRIEIERNQVKFESLETLLERENGLQVRRFGDQGSSSSLSIRGSSAQQVDLYLDGIPLQNSSAIGIDLSSLSAESLGSIDVFRSFAPGELGSAPMGGTVQLNTRDIAQKNTSLKAAVGSWGLQQFSLKTELPKNQHGWFLNWDHMKSKGDYSFYDDNFTSDDESDDVKKTRINNDATQEHFFAKWQYRAKGRLSWLLDFVEKNKGIAGSEHFQSSDTRIESRQWISGLNYHIENNYGKISTGLYAQHYLDEYRDLTGPSGQIGVGRQDQENQRLELGANSDWSRSIKQHYLQADYRIQRERYTPKDNLNSIALSKSNRTLQVLNFGDSYYGFDWMSLHPQVQFHFINNSFSATSQSDYEQVTTWQMGALVPLQSDLILKLNAGTGIRLPKFSELFGDRGIVQGKSDLKQEESTTYDFGFNWKPLWKFEQWHSPSFDISAYQSERKQLIQFVFNSQGVGRAENIANAEVKGLDLSQSLEYSNWFRFKQDFSWIDSKITESNFSTDLGKQVPGLYAFSYFATAIFSLRQFDLNVDYQILNDMYYDKTNLLKAADPKLLHLGLSYNYKNWKTHLQLNNLLDEQVENYNGWPLPGRGGQVSFSYHFL